LTSAIQDLDPGQEADRPEHRLEEHIKEKRKRDFEIRLLKGELEKRKKYPRGVPPGPYPEELREQRERDAEKAQKDAEHRLRCKQAKKNRPLMVRQGRLGRILQLIQTTIVSRKQQRTGR
jgi:hypothetical protein